MVVDLLCVSLAKELVDEKDVLELRFKMFKYFPMTEELVASGILTQNASQPQNTPTTADRWRIGCCFGCSAVSGGQTQAVSHLLVGQF